MIRILSALLALTFQAGAFGTDLCMQCHSRLQGNLSEVARQYETSIHFTVGLSCAACHGGDPNTSDSALAKDRRKGFKRRFHRVDIVNLCGSCHSSPEYMRRFDPALHVDQVSEYRTSEHGRLAARGDTRVATCTSCHSVHDILKASDPRSPVSRLKLADTCGKCHSDAGLMRSYGIEHDQVAEYRTSRHAVALYQKGDPSAPTCSTCHGSHGTVPPGASSVEMVCSKCHVRQRELFENSPHYSVFAARQLKGCIACHAHHSVDSPEKSLLTGASTACVPCHKSDQIQELVERWGHSVMVLRERIDFSRRFLSDVRHSGLDITKPTADLGKAWDRVGDARQEIHSADGQRVMKSVDEGRKLADSAYAEGMLALERDRSRSHWHYGFEAAFGMLVLFGSVYLLHVFTERRRELAALRLERERVALSRERLARVGEISTGLAHAIRNPLHGVLNCVDMLKARLSQQEPNQNILALMSEGLQRIQGVTQRLLVLTRETPLQKVPTDISVLIEDAVRFMEVRFHRRGLTVECDTGEIPLLSLDPNQFTEALLNVLDNAVDACKLGGTIKIRSFVRRVDKDLVQIEISDNGEGISPEDLPKVFDPFFTSKPIGEGTGLGLAITRRIVEEHGGKVSVESQLGEGTRVNFWLPLSKDS